MAKKFLFCIVCILFIISCGDQKIDTASVKEEIKSREIRVISDAEILKQALEIGNALTGQFTIDEQDNGTFDIRLKADSVFVSSYYLFEKENDLSGKAKALFQAHAFDKENIASMTPNIQVLDEGKTLLYTAPMISDQKAIGMWAIKLPRKDVILRMND